MPKISVIVPVYNTEKYLGRCIDSILEQTFTDFELLLVDDGSTDKSGAICDEYAAKDARIRVFHKQNGGVSSARNIGLENASGEWITFCDADDWADERWLEEFQNKINNGFDLIIQGIIEHNPSEELSNWGIDFSGNPKECLDAINGHIGYCFCKIFKKDIIGKHVITFNEDFSFCEDEDFVIKYIKHCKLITSTSIGHYHYRKPIFKIKYKEVDNFDCICSRFNSLKDIYTDSLNGLCKHYLKLMCNAYFATTGVSFQKHVCRTALFCQSIEGIEYLCPISRISIILIKHIKSPKILTSLFIIKKRLLKF